MNTNYMLGYGRYFNKLLQGQNGRRIIQRNKSDTGIQIPPRIERGPLDILKALSATIKREPDGIDYKYQSGIIFKPVALYQRRAISLSFDSGRKSAKWIIAQNPRLFQHRTADPYIEAFAPPKKYNEYSEVSEEILLDAIENIKVSEAISIYNALQKKNIDVSQSTKQKLLELTCYYNSTDKPDETLVETEYYENPKTDVLNTWNSGQFAETLIKEMEMNVEALSAVILGMFKYNNVKGAIEMYNSATEEGIVFPVEVYNAVLENPSEQKFEYEDQEKLIKDTLQLMADKKVTPNADTLNSSLKGVAGMRKWFKARDLALKLFSEFTHWGIEPSLATYYFLLDIFFDRKKTHAIFDTILKELEGKTLVLRHVDDFKFFPKAMEICCYNFQDFRVAERLHSLLSSGCNKHFLRGNYNESIYYRSYLSAAFRYEDIDRAMEIYNQLTPNIHMPEIATLLTILNALAENRAWKHIPKMWEDIKHQQIVSIKVLNLVLPLLGAGFTDTGDNIYMDIAKEAWEKINSLKKERMDSQLISAFLNVFSAGKETEMAYAVFEKAQDLGRKYIELSHGAIMSFLDVCIHEKDKSKAMDCMEYSAFVEDSAIAEIVAKVKSGFELSQQELRKIEKLTKAKDT